MLLEPQAGQRQALLRADLAQRLQLAQRQVWTMDSLRQALAAAGRTLHGADQIFYFPAVQLDALSQSPQPDGCRPLTPDDQALFAAFQGGASEQDLDAAYVELDHWLVMGVFAEGRLAGAGSLYPWRESSGIADMGLLTLPAFRRRGHAHKLARAMGRAALRRGFEPQYRSQPDNLASLAVARAAGLALYGSWDIIHG